MKRLIIFLVLILALGGFGCSHINVSSQDYYTITFGPLDSPNKYAINLPNEIPDFMDRNSSFVCCSVIPFTESWVLMVCAKDAYCSTYPQYGLVLDLDKIKGDDDIVFLFSYTDEDEKYWIYFDKIPEPIQWEEVKEIILEQQAREEVDREYIDSLEST